jgi:uncharacterized protein (DUF924 family)
MQDVESILSFWLEPKPATEEQLKERGKLWFGGGPDLDRQVKDRFGALLERARTGELDSWASEARSRLALIILLDQFSRNVYRGSPDAFAQDEKALELARTGLDANLFDGMDALDRLFVTLPFSHAEDLDAQKRAVRSCQAAIFGAPPAWRKMLTDTVDFGRKHLDVIARFGRFPHRNATLGRASTKDEEAYLAYLAEVGQWL